MSKNKKDRMPNILIILLAFFIFTLALHVRIQYVNQTLIDTPIRADASQYVIYGYNLVNHGTFSKEFPSDNPCPDSFRSPGYPLLIALALILGGDQGFYPIVIYTQTVLGASVALLTFCIAIQFLPLWGSIAAGILVALSPHLVSMTSYILTETLFSFTLLVSVFCFIQALRQRHVLLFVSSSVFFGYTYLTNQTALFIPFLFAFPVLLSNGLSVRKIQKNRLLRKTALFLIIFSLFPISWALRNNIYVPPHAAKGSSRAISNMSHGAYPGFIYKDPRFIHYPYREDPMQPEFGSSLGSFRKIFWARFKQRPGRYLMWYFLEKPYYLWSWNVLQGQGDVFIYPVKISLYHTSKIANFSREIMKYLHPVILISAIGGIPLILIKFRQKKFEERHFNTVIFLFLICIYYTLLCTIFAPWPRYSIPLRPELYLFALWSIKFGGKLIIRKAAFDESEYKHLRNTGRKNQGASNQSFDEIE